MGMIQPTARKSSAPSDESQLESPQSNDWGDWPTTVRVRTFPKWWRRPSEFGSPPKRLQFLFYFRPFPYAPTTTGPLPGSPTAGYWPSLSESGAGGFQQQQDVLAGNNRQTDNQMPGYLPNFRGDSFTDSGRIQVDAHAICFCRSTHFEGDPHFECTIF